MGGCGGVGGERGGGEGAVILGWKLGIRMRFFGKHAITFIGKVSN